MNGQDTLLRSDMYRVLALGFAHPHAERLDMLQGILQDLTTAEPTASFAAQMRRRSVNGWSDLSPVRRRRWKGSIIACLPPP